MLSTARGVRQLARMTWPEAAGNPPLLLAVPVGATEQHGPHLPLGTDSTVAEALTRRLAALRPDVAVAPTLPYGSSGEHAGFPGTLSIGQDALALVVMELVRSADAFAGVALVSGHGGNAEPLARAVRTLTSEGRAALAWWPAPPGGPTPGGGPSSGDAHAGRTETSVLLALDPAAVDQDRARPGDRRPLGAVASLLRAEGLAAVSPNGVLGDPAGASAREGRLLLAGWTADLVAAVQARWPADADPVLDGPAPGARVRDGPGPDGRSGAGHGEGRPGG